jgi:hypothetical protein
MPLHKSFLESYTTIYFYFLFLLETTALELLALVSISLFLLTSLTGVALIISDKTKHMPLLYAISNLVLS